MQTEAPDSSLPPPLSLTSVFSSLLHCPSALSLSFFVPLDVEPLCDIIPDLLKDILNEYSDQGLGRTDCALRDAVASNL